MKNKNLISLFLAIPFFVMSQNNDKAQPQVSMLLFVDTYYIYDFNNAQTDYRQDFLFNHNRHNETNLNLGLLKLAVEQEKYRVNLGLQVGTYAIDNYSAENETARLIHEANVGIALDENEKIWLDAGILPSHIGFESAISINNPSLTRSLAAENSPYFLTGFRLSYKINEHWDFAALLVNGWQRIQKVKGNSIPSGGTQLNYHKNDFSFNWSTFVGSEFPNEERKMRYFNDFFVTQKFGELSLTAGFDIGWQQIEKNSKHYDYWYTPTLIGHYQFTSEFATALRFEYYNDENGVIINPSQNGFNTFGTSLNFDYQPFSNLYLRTEARYFKGNDDYFNAKENFQDDDFFIGFSLAYKFTKEF
ncbi:porin [Mesonia maritima]|uniref:Beta-barrel porin-2, OmpL-like. bbp2 n=1 Tax=Mesonia maritima TaxID=1793873 RepID=A0ABU1K8F5_9FLAO|nr:porin [Mesonia maritima]MDR6301540.1 hypothetical protein [Mesonia maritima]